LFKHVRARLSHPLLAPLAVGAVAVLALLLSLDLVPYQSYVLHQGSLALGVLVGIGLLVALAYLAWNTDPAWIITAAVVLWPFNNSWTYFGFPGGVAPDRLLLLAGFAALILRAPPARDRPPIRARPIHALFALTVLWAIGSGIAAQTIASSDGIFLILDRMVVPMAVFVLAPVAFRTERHRKVLLAGLVGAGAYVALTTFFEGTGLHALVFPRFILDPSVGFHLKFGETRARGPFLEAGVNGLGLYAYAVASAVAFTQWRARWARAVALGVIAFAAIGILMTLTRAAWLASVIATVLTMAGTRQLRRFLVPTVLTGAVFVAVALVAVPSLHDQVNERRAAQQSVWERENIDSAALRMVLDHPLTGVGLVAFNEHNETYFRQPADYPLVAELRLGVHNVFLLLASELGLIGLTLFVVSFGTAMGTALRARGAPDQEAWRVGLVAIALFWVVNANFAPLGYVFAGSMSWLWAGVALAGTRVREAVA
jgi:O-antigen ligase